MHVCLRAEWLCGCGLLDCDGGWREVKWGVMVGPFVRALPCICRSRNFILLKTESDHGFLKWQEDVISSSFCFRKMSLDSIEGRLEGKRLKVGRKSVVRV